MLVHKLGHYPTRFHLNGEIPPYIGPEPFGSRLERMHARGTHAITYTNLAPHSHPYARDTCKFHLIPTFSWSSSGETLICGPRIVSPLDILLTGVARRSCRLIFDRIDHRMM